MNVVVYSKNKSSSIAEMLSNLDDNDIRVEDSSKLSEYKTLNAGLLCLICPLMKLKIWQWLQNLIAAF